MEQLEQTEGNQEQTETPEGKAETQPTVDELRAEIDRKETVIQGLKKDIKNLQRQGGSKAEIDALSKKIDDVQEQIAGWMDDVVTKVSGEETPPQRKSYKEELKARRESQPKQQVDPEAQRFFDYCEDKGLHIDYDDLDNCDPMIKEVLQETGNFKNGLRNLKERVKKMSETEIDKLADEKAKGMRQSIKEELIKELGLADQGAKTPSGANRTFDQLEQDFIDGKVDRKTYEEARKEQGYIY